MRRASIAALPLVVLLLAGGCGGSSGPSSPDTPEEKAVAKTYSDYIDALKAGDGKRACALLTPAFQRRAGTSVAVGERSNLKGAACVKAISAGTLPAIQQVVAELKDVNVNGDRASGLDPGEGKIGPQEVFFERIGGDWKISRTVFFR